MKATDNVSLALEHVLDVVKLHNSTIEEHRKQIGRIIQCIGEFDLNKQQRYYLHKAIWGDDDDK